MYNSIANYVTIEPHLLISWQYTILHTEFVRERAEPGMLALGSDSHTCSAGAVSCLAIGLGAADVMTALATGETWIKVPESIRCYTLYTKRAQAKHVRCGQNRRVRWPWSSISFLRCTVCNN
jgi:homoaconitase/3-isopropylmalate dehydratase large subunit